jgi:hypothetical protein
MSLRTLSDILDFIIFVAMMALLFFCRHYFQPDIIVVLIGCGVVVFIFPLLIIKLFLAMNPAYSVEKSGTILALEDSRGRVGYRVLYHDRYLLNKIKVGELFARYAYFPLKMKFNVSLDPFDSACKLQVEGLTVVFKEDYLASKSLMRDLVYNYDSGEEIRTAIENKINIALNAAFNGGTITINSHLTIDLDLRELFRSKLEEVLKEEPYELADAHFELRGSFFL